MAVQCSIQKSNTVRRKTHCFGHSAFFHRRVRRCVMRIYIYIYPFLCLIFSSSLNTYVRLKNASAEGAIEKYNNSSGLSDALYLILTKILSWKRRTHLKWFRFLWKIVRRKKTHLFQNCAIFERLSAFKRTKRTLDWTLAVIPGISSCPWLAPT